MSTGVTRARDELTAAHVLAVSGLTAQANDVALRGAVAAAEVALLVLDRVPPADQAGLTAEFVRRVVRDRGLDPDTGRRLRLLLNRQRLAEIGPPPPEETAAAIDDARFVIETVAAWVETSRQVARDRLRPPR